MLQSEPERARRGSGRELLGQRDRPPYRGAGPHPRRIRRLHDGRRYRASQAIRGRYL